MVKKLLILAFIFVLGSCVDSDRVVYHQAALQEHYQVPSRQIELISEYNYLVYKDSSLYHVKIAREKVLYEREITFK